MPRLLASLALLAAGGAIAFSLTGAGAAETAVKAPMPAVVAPPSGKIETAVFAGGCFWGVEGVFSHVRGVLSTTSSYTGGKLGPTDYEAVSTGTTGNAEAVRVAFDPSKISYAELLRIYFSVVADPTTSNAQGPDHVTQYRSALFPATPAQARVARAYIAQLSAAHVYSRPIVTRIEAPGAFHPAEAYHQGFMTKNSDYPYIVINDRPKVEALQRLFPRYYRA